MYVLGMVLLALIHAAGVYFLSEILRELGLIREAMNRSNDSRQKPIRLSDDITTVTELVADMPVYAIWIHNGNRWEVDPASIPSGYRAGSQPSFPGSFAGQRVKTECVPRAASQRH